LRYAELATRLARRERAALPPPSSMVPETLDWKGTSELGGLLGNDFVRG
jgi:hypothetical protein